MPGLEGTTVQHYQLRRCLGRGGMSEVYLAVDIESEREVAIKLVNRSQHEHSARFQREIKAMGRLSHAHILPILDSGEHDSWYYLVTPYIRQGTLREHLRRHGPLTPDETAIILEQVAGALQCAHDQGIVHRDIKPSNILLLEESHTYLADFGLAKAIEGDNEITQANFLIGTPEYIAPELIDGPARASSDIYALGVLLYEMLTGQVPFKADTPVAVCWKHLHEKPARPSLLNPAIPRTVEQVILRALEKDPYRRFKSARALVQAYKWALDSEKRLVTLHHTAETEVPAHPRGRHQWRQYEKKIDGALPARAHTRDEGLIGRFALSGKQKLLVGLIAVIFLLVASPSLGFLAALDGLQAKPPAAYSALVPLVNQSELHQKPILTPPPTPTQTAYHARVTTNNSSIKHKKSHVHKRDDKDDSDDSTQQDAGNQGDPQLLYHATWPDSGQGDGFVTRSGQWWWLGSWL